MENPSKLQVGLEEVVKFLNNFADSSIGKHGAVFASYLGTIALYILLSNIIGIFGLVPPTKDINVTAALAVMSAFLIYGAQFRYRGLRGGLKQFAKPMPLLFPINLMEIIIRPLACVCDCSATFWVLLLSWSSSSSCPGGGACTLQHLL